LFGVTRRKGCVGCCFTLEFKALNVYLKSDFNYKQLELGVRFWNFKWRN